MNVRMIMRDLHYNDFHAYIEGDSIIIEFKYGDYCEVCVSPAGSYSMVIYKAFEEAKYYSVHSNIALIRFLREEFK